MLTRTKHELKIKLIAQMETNLRDKFILANVYCSTTLSNHGLIRLNRFVSQISLSIYAISFVISVWLILQISFQTSDVTGTEV
jgi:hypothetical protein